MDINSLPPDVLSSLASALNNGSDPMELLSKLLHDNQVAEPEVAAPVAEEPEVAPVVEPVAPVVSEEPVAPVAEPKVAPVVEPEVAPVVEPKVAPVVEPEAPVAEPKVAPVVEPEVAPVVEPEVAPVVQQNVVQAPSVAHELLSKDSSYVTRKQHLMSVLNGAPQSEPKQSSLAEKQYQQRKDQLVSLLSASAPKVEPQPGSFLHSQHLKHKENVLAALNGGKSVVKKQEVVFQQAPTMDVSVSNVPERKRLLLQLLGSEVPQPVQPVQPVPSVQNSKAQTPDSLKKLRERAEEIRKRLKK